MALTQEQAAMLLMERQGKLLAGLAEDFKALRGLVADGLSISSLPELPVPSITVPQGPNVDITELSAVVSESIRSSNAALTEQLVEMAEQNRELGKHLKNAGLQSGIRAVGSARLRATKANGAPVDVRANDDGEILTTATFTATGSLTDDELRASPIPVTFPADESGLTDIELRAAPVVVDTGLATQTDALTDAQLRATAVPVSGTVSVDNHPAAPTDFPDAALLARTPNVVGTWGYAAGVAGTPTIPAGARILSMTASAGLAAGTVAVDGGDTVTVPASSSWIANPEGNLVAPSVVFTGTSSYYVDWVV